MATFKLTQFNPVGFKETKYPTDYCSLCHGFLNNPCSTCLDNDTIICPVNVSEDKYFHVHCHNMMPKNTAGQSGKK